MENKKVCKHFVNGNCKNGSSCEFLHVDNVCSHYFFGDCKFGDQCKQSHQYKLKSKDKFFEWILEKTNDPTYKCWGRLEQSVPISDFDIKIDGDRFLDLPRAHQCVLFFNRGFYELNNLDFFGFYFFKFHSAYWSFPSGHSTSLGACFMGLFLIFEMSNPFS